MNTKEISYVEDIEDILDRKEEEFKQVKNELKLKENEFDSLEDVVTERVKEINDLRANKVSMSEQIAEAIQLEKRVDVQSIVIQQLKGNLKEKENVKLVDKEEEFNMLMKDIGQLHKNYF